jgi:hypothetical protein
MSAHETKLDRAADSLRAARAAQIVAAYEPLVKSVARAAVVDRVLAHAIAHEAIVAVLTMPESRRTNAHVIETTRRIATDAACRFAGAVAT